jgi:hemolysin activation/secretion protein
MSKNTNGLLKGAFAMLAGVATTEDNESPQTEQSQAAEPTADQSVEPLADAASDAPVTDAPEAPTVAEDPPIEAPVIHRITRLDQARALTELAEGEEFTPATEAHTDIQAFKSIDGRTLRVVLAGGSLNSVEI